MYGTVALPKRTGVKKVAVRIIMGTKKLSYNEELKILKLETLEKRRTNLCLRFAKKMFKKWKNERSFPSKKIYSENKNKKTKKVQNNEIQNTKNGKILPAIYESIIEWRKWE